MDFDTFAEAWSVSDRRPVYEWAADHVVLPPRLARPGRFSIADTRHLSAPFDALQSDHVREVNVMAPPRSGKTLLVDVWLPWIVRNDPGPYLHVFQKDPIAHGHAKERTLPTLRACPPVAALMPGDDNETMQRIRFLNGMQMEVSGPALSNLQSRGFRYVVFDEPWMIDAPGSGAGYRPGAIAEGRARLGDFEKLQTEKLVCISQGGEEGGEWATQFDSGERNEWHVECQSCREFSYTGWSMRRVADGKEVFAGMRWDEHKSADGLWLAEKCAATARWECPRCGHPHFDNGRTKGEWNRTGKYVTTGEVNRRKKSFHWTGVIDSPWANMVEQYLGALNEWKLRGSPIALIQFFQKRMAQCKSEGSIAGDAQKFSRETYAVDATWPDEAARFMTIDRQEEDVYYWTIRAWSQRGESRRLAFGKAFGDAELEKIREQWKVKAGRTLIDSGYRPKGDNGVYALCVRYGWFALKGDDTACFYHQSKRGRIQRSYSEITQGDPESGTGKSGRRFASLIRFSSAAMADRLSQLIGKGQWIEPVTDGAAGSEIDYGRQMSAEVKRERRNKSTGRVENVWVAVRKDNHFWDCAKMQVLAATLAGCLPDPFEATT